MKKPYISAKTAKYLLIASCTLGIPLKALAYNDFYIKDIEGCDSIKNNRGQTVAPTSALRRDGSPYACNSTRNRIYFTAYFNPKSGWVKREKLSVNGGYLYTAANTDAAMNRPFYSELKDGDQTFNTTGEAYYTMGGGDTATIELKVHKTTPDVIQFFATADTQYDNRGKNGSSDVMMGVINNKLRAGQGMGLIVAGDLTMNTRVDETNMQFDKALPRYMLASFGNHDIAKPEVLQNLACISPDLSPGTCVSNDYLSAYTMGFAQQSTPLDSRFDPLGFYSWDWGQVHFVNASVFPGYSKGNDNTIDKLAEDLKRFVGSSNRPVVIASHYGFDTMSMGGNDRWWSESQRKVFLATIRKYNVIALLTGHSHVNAYDTGAMINVQNDSTAFNKNGTVIPDIVVGAGTEGNGAYVTVTIDTKKKTLAFEKRSAVNNDSIGWSKTYNFDMPDSPANSQYVGTLDNPREWNDNGKNTGNAGEIYSYINTSIPTTASSIASCLASNGFTDPRECSNQEYFSLKKTGWYWYFPTDHKSNDTWEYLGHIKGTTADPKYWKYNDIGTAGSIYAYPRDNGKIEYFSLKNNGPYWYFPTDRSDNQYWHYLYSSDDVITVAPGSMESSFSTPGTDKDASGLVCNSDDGGTKISEIKLSNGSANRIMTLKNVGDTSVLITSYLYAPACYVSHTLLLGPGQTGILRSTWHAFNPTGSTLNIYGYAVKDRLNYSAPAAKSGKVMIVR